MARVRAALDVSERRACRALGLHRSGVRYGASADVDEAALVRRVRELALANTRYGYRRVAALLRAEGRRVNAKRVLRVWRDEGLKVPRRQRKRPMCRNAGRAAPWGCTGRGVDEAALVRRVRELALANTRYCYRRVAALLRAEGRRVNAKRVLRVWRDEGLKVPRRQRKRRRLGRARGDSGPPHGWRTVS